MEGELRSMAKKDHLSSKVITLRKDVEAKRDQLRKLQTHRDDNKREQQELWANLKSVEFTEKRRNEVSLETEKSLTEAKFEL
jgi:hypothetical protein